MKWIHKLFKMLTPEKMEGNNSQEGISLENPKWEVSSIRDPQAFLRALNIILPEGAILYFEDGCPDKEIRSFFDSRKVSNPIKIECGTSGNPVRFHLPFTHANITELVDIMERHAQPELAMHFHSYKDNKIILQWYDAFDDPMYISEAIEEEKIKRLCEELSLKYKPITK